MKYSQRIEYKLVREKEEEYNGIVKSPEDVFKWFQRLEDSDTEKFITICLSAQNKVLCFDMVTNGTVNQAAVEIREILKAAILTGASSIIVVHNHPSGDPEPSEDDIKITNKIREACEIMGIELADHVIVGLGTYYSFLDNGK